MRVSAISKTYVYCSGKIVNMHRTLLLVLISFLLFLSASVNDVQRKVIRTNSYDIHCYVSLKEKNTTKGKLYFWYNGGEIHQSFGDASGQLLHLEYVAYHRNNQLAEKGEFNYGLKKGVWKRWHSNGALSELTKWSNGVKNGYYYKYDESGVKLASGKYRGNVKSGVWVDYRSNDTTWYVKGKPFKESPKVLKRRKDSLNPKTGFFERIFSERDTVRPKMSSFFKSLFKTKTDSTATKKVNKKSFWQRLFCRDQQKTKG